MKIETIKLLRDANGTLTGYLINNVKTVPLDEANTDYLNIQKWVAEGNTPEDAD